MRAHAYFFRPPNHIPFLITINYIQYYFYTVSFLKDTMSVN